MKNIWLTFFFALALLELFAEATANNTLTFCTKPLLMPTLAVWLASTVSRPFTRPFFRGAILGALVFSAVGDVLLMFSGTIFFLSGLGFFLFAHLFYIGAFTSVASLRNGFLRAKLWYAVPFLLLPVVLLYFLWGGIQIGMKFPVTLYACVITGMALSVLNVKTKVSNPVFARLLAGAILFLASDSLIAGHKFGQELEGGRLAIMLTYLAGQFLLVSGARSILLEPKVE